MLIQDMWSHAVVSVVQEPQVKKDKMTFMNFRNRYVETDY